MGLGRSGLTRPGSVIRDLGLCCADDHLPTSQLTRSAGEFRTFRESEVLCTQGRNPTSVIQTTSDIDIRQRLAERPVGDPLTDTRPQAAARSRRVSMSSRGTGNNRAVSTAAASSFLGGPGLRRGTGWSSARPERVAGVAGPLGGLAALVSPGVPGPLQLRGRGSGSRRRVQKARNSRSAGRRRRPARGPGGTAAVSRSRTAGPGEPVPVGGDAAGDRPHPGQPAHLIG